MISILIFIGFVVLLVIRSEIKTRRWMNAFDLHNDMFKKYEELVKYDFMTDKKWKEWLPIFDDADKICARDCPDMNFEPISLKIKRRINNEEPIQD